MPNPWKFIANFEGMDLKYLKQLEYEAKLEPLKLQGGGNSDKELSKGVFTFYGTTYICFLGN